MPKPPKGTEKSSKLVKTLSSHARNAYGIPKNVTDQQVEARIATNQAAFEEAAKDYYEKNGNKEKSPSYEVWIEKQYSAFGNPFDTNPSKKKDSSDGSQAASDTMENGVSEGQNTSRVETKKQAPKPQISEEITQQQAVEKKANEFNKQAENANYDGLFMDGTPENYKPTTTLSAEQQSQFQVGRSDVQSQQNTQTDKATVQPTNTQIEQEKKALKESQKNKEFLKSNLNAQADYFLGTRDGYSVTGSLETDGIKQGQVDMNLNYNPDLPETEQEQIYSKLIAQDNQFMRDTGRGSNMDYIKSKTEAGDYSGKDQFKRYQQVFGTRMNALNAKIETLSKDEAFIQKYQAYAQAAHAGDDSAVVLSQDPQIVEFLEASNQQAQLQKLGDDKDFIKSQFGEDVGKEYLNDVVAQKKADMDYVVGKATPFIGTTIYSSTEAQNMLKQVGYAGADFLTGLASLARIPGSSSEYGFGDKIADWANEQNEDLKAYFPEPTQIAQPIFKNKVDQEGKVVRDEKGEIVTEVNLEVLPYKLTRAVTDLGLQIAGTKGMGSIKGFNAMRGSSAIGMGAMSFTQTYNQSFQQALEKGESRQNAETFAITNAFLTASLESIAPNTWATKGVGMSDNLFASMVKNGFKPNAMKAAVKEFGKETVGEIAEETSQNISSKMLETSMNIGQYRQKLDSDQTFQQEMMETVLITSFLGAGMGIGAGKAKYSQMNNLTKASAFEIAMNPAFTQEKIKEQFKLQNVPASKQNELLQQLDDIKELHESLSDSDKRGKYTRNIIDLSLQREDLVRQSRNHKLPPVLKDKYDAQIQELDTRLEEVVARNQNLATPMQIADENTTLEEFQKVSSQKQGSEVLMSDTEIQELANRNAPVNREYQNTRNQPLTQRGIKAEIDSSNAELGAMNARLEGYKKRAEAYPTNENREDLEERQSIINDLITQRNNEFTERREQLESLRVELKQDPTKTNELKEVESAIQILEEGKSQFEKGGVLLENQEAVNAKRKTQIVEATKEKAQLQEELRNTEITPERQSEIDTRVKALDENIKSLTSNVVEAEGSPQQETVMLDEARFTKAQRRSMEAPADNTVIESEGNDNPLQVQERNPLSEKEIQQLKVQKKQLDKEFGDAQKTKDYTLQSEIATKIEGINEQLNPKLKKNYFGNSPREIKINIAAATKRALAESTESETWKDMQDDYRSKRTALNNLMESNASQKLINKSQTELDTLQKEMHEKGQELIESIFERETGLKIKSIENAVGRFDNDLEPSHVITFEIKNNEEFAKVEEAASRFSERTLQDAYIISQDITPADETLIQRQLGKPSWKVLVHEDIDFGERGKGKVVRSQKYVFNTPFSQQEILKIEKYLRNSPIESFTIADDGKSIEFQLFSFKTTPTEVIEDIRNQVKKVGEFSNKLKNDYRRSGQTIERSSISFYRAANQILDGTAKTGKTQQERDSRTYARNESTSKIRQTGEVKSNTEKPKIATEQSPPPQKGRDAVAKAVSRDSNESGRKIIPKNRSRNANLKETGKLKAGKETEVVFSAEDKPVKGYFAFVELESVQASHTTKGKLNSLKHFISKAQPKSWTDDRETKANKMRDNLRPNDVMGQASTPYNGTPVLNERGEVIQGNGRAIGLGRNYKKGGKNNEYRDKLTSDAALYGLNSKDAEGMKNPLLVRIVPVSDKEAIRLGQKKSTDLESGGDTRVGVPNTVTTINSHQPTRRGELPALQQIASIFGRDSFKDRSIAQLLLNSEFVNDVLSVMYKVGAITTTERSNMLTDGLLNAKGKADLTAIFDGLSLTRGVPDSISTMQVVDTFATMPSSIQEAINESTKSLLEAGKGVGNTLYNAFRAYNTFRKNQNKFGKFSNWINQMGIDVESPIDTFGKDGINVARFFEENSSDKKVVKEGFEYFMAHYTQNIKGEQPTIINMDGIDPMNQQDAATEASVKLLEKYRPQPKGQPASAGRESRGSKTRNSETQRKAVEKMVERLKKAFPNINVEFNENLTNPNGDVIPGVFQEGEIVLNPTQMTMEDAIEEHAHLYLELAKGINKTVYSEGKRLINNSQEGRKILAEVKQDYPDLSEEAQYNEAIAKAIARYGVNVKKPTIFSRFVNNIKKKIGNGLRAMDRKTNATYFTDYLTTTKRFDVGKMSLADYSKVIAGELLNETPLSYITSEQLERFANDDKGKVENITVERGLLQSSPTILDKFIGNVISNARTDMNQGKFVSTTMRTKDSRIEANQLRIVNNKFILEENISNAVNSEFANSDLKGKDLKAAKAAFATQIYEDVNQALRGEKPFEDLPDTIVPIVKDMRTHIDSMTKQLIKEGFLPNDDMVGQFNENLTIFIRRNFDIEQTVKTEVEKGVITKAEADAKMKSITATSVATNKAKKANEGDVDLSFTMQDGTTHDFKGLNAQDIYYLFGKEQGREIMKNKDTFDIDGKKMYQNPLYAVMMANIGKYVNRSYAIHRAKDLKDYLHTVPESVMQEVGSFFAKRLRNPEIASVKVQKMGNGNYSLTFKNKYGTESSDLKHSNLRADEVVAIIDSDIKNGKKVKEVNSKIKKEISNNQKTKFFEIQMPKGVTSSQVQFTASQVDINAEINSYLEGQISKSKGDDRQPSAKPAKKNTGILNKQKEIPKVLRDLMGENNDPVTVYENTALKMGNLLHTQELINNLWREGGEALFSDKPTTTLSSKQIAANGNSAYAPLDGKYTSPELYKILFEGEQKEANIAIRAWLMLNGIAKAGLTVYSLGSNTRNFLGAAVMVVGTGNFSPLNIKKAYQITRENVKPGKYRDFYEEGVRLGVFSQNLDTNILKGQLDRAMGKTKLTGIPLVKKFFSKFYQFPDDMAKAMAMLGELDTERKAAKHTGEKVTEKQLMERAAEKVKAILPNYSLTSKGMQKLSRNAVFGTFVMFTAETLRNRYNTASLAWSEIMSDNPAYKVQGAKRMAALAASLTAAPALTLATMAAIDMEEEEEEGIRATMPEYSRNNLFLWTGRNDKGEPTYLDLSYIDPSSLFYKPIIGFATGKDSMESFNEMLRETFTPFIGTEIFTKDTWNAINNEDDFGRKISESPSTTWQFVKRGSHAGKNLVPKIIKEGSYMVQGIFNEFIEKEEDKFKNYTRDINIYEELSNNFLGTKARSYDSKKNFRNVIYQLKDAYANGTKFLKEKTPALQDANKATDKVGQVVKDYKLSEVREEYRKTARKVAAAIKAMERYEHKNNGRKVSTKELVKKIAKETGFAAKHIEKILNGDLEYTPFDEDKFAL